MKLFISAVSTGLLLANMAFAAQDHNSSRSNKTSSINAPEETEILLKEAKEEALAVTKAMLDVDQKKDRYDGDYVISVDVKVTVERVKREKGSGQATGRR